MPHDEEAADPLGFGLPTADGELPPHLDRCMVCGPRAPASYGLVAHRQGNEVVASFTFGPAHEGGPYLAHGGAVAAVCDDLLGHVLRLVGTPAVTGRLEVDYIRPVALGERLRLVARLDRREGRKLWIVCEGRDEKKGDARFAARGLFVQVARDHFLSRLPPDERLRAESASSGGDATAW